MKQERVIKMRKLVFLMGLFLLVSCEREIEVKVQKTIEVEDIGGLEFEYSDMDVYHIQEIDGCEYILVNGMDNREPALTHKGNCKYCLERNKQSVIEVNKKEEY
jgi:hypothetical protein